MRAKCPDRGLKPREIRRLALLPISGLATRPQRAHEQEPHNRPYRRARRGRNRRRGERGRPSVDLPSIGGSEDTAEPTAEASDTSDPEAEAEAEEAEEEKELELPSNPDDVRGTDSYALTRAPNLRRALRVLDARRRKVEGVFDLVRVAPGRIDTTIIHPDDRMTTIQVNANRDISFENLIDFPTQPGFRKNGLTARDVPAQKVGRLLRAIDRERNGSAARDVDYVVIDRDIIDSAST